MFGFLKKKKKEDDALSEYTQKESEKKIKTYDDEYGHDDYDETGPIDDFSDGDY